MLIEYTFPGLVALAFWLYTFLVIVEDILGSTTTPYAIFKFEGFFERFPPFPRLLI